jgi:pilus assembly protein TadC
VQAEEPDTSSIRGGLDDVTLLLDLLAAGTDAGLPLVRALEVLGGTADEQIRQGLATVTANLRLGTSWDTAWAGAAKVQRLLELHEALNLAARTGAPASALLTAEAAQLRRERKRLAEERAATLGVRLVLPLGLCFLPAFLCLGVVPVVLAMAGGLLP